MRWLQRVFVFTVLMGAFFTGAFVSRPGRAQPIERDLPVALAPVRAVGIRVDTLFVGGYAAGSFTEAVHTLARDLAVEERELVGQHLDKIFGDVVQENGLGRAGRLRLAYERAIRPDGTTRGIRVLTAEAAVAGERSRGRGA